MTFPKSLPYAIGSFTQAMVLSAALAARINDLRLERRRLTQALEYSNANLEGMIAERTAEVLALQRDLVETAREAGRAAVAIGVLHNLGNALNSVVTQHSLIAELFDDSKLRDIAKAARLLEENRTSLATYLSSDPRGQKVPEFIIHSVARLEIQQDRFREEVRRLGSSVRHICMIVEAQWEHAKLVGATEQGLLSDFFAEILELCNGRRPWADEELVCSFEFDPTLSVDRHRLTEVLLQLITNAREASDEMPGQAGRVEIKTEAAGDRHVRITVSDNGVGIESDELKSVFKQGYSMPSGSHTSGLHSAANTISGADSDGEGQGALFWIELPCQ